MQRILQTILSRPVAVFMAYLALIILGLLSLREFELSLLPPLNFPEVTVHTTYPDAMPAEVEHNISVPLEEAISGIRGVTDVTSRSMQEESVIKVSLAWGADMKYAALNIRQQADRVYSRFPQNALRPVIHLRNPQRRPITTIALSGADIAHLKQLSEYVIGKRLEQLEGVAEATVMGAPEREIHIEVNPDVLRSQGFSMPAIEQALRQNNILSRGGSIKRGNFRLTLRMNSEYRSVNEIAQTPVFNEKGNLFVPLTKLAVIEDGFAEPESRVRMNGKQCVAIDIRKESGTNTLNVHNRLLTVVKQLRNRYPSLHLTMVHTQAGFIKEAINSVGYAILIGGLLAVLVLFMFLYSWRAPLIIALSIPVSILAAFLWMRFTDIGLNVISLAGLALGGGMLVDNSIIVLENIHRYRDQGYGSFQAAVKGTSEVALPITGATLTTIAVFTPVLFLNDVSSAIFTQQAKTVTYALLASLAVGFTLLPVLYIKFKPRSALVHRDNEGFFNSRIIPYYEKLLKKILQHENRFLLMVVLLLIAALMLLLRIDRRLLPHTEQNAIEAHIDYKPGVSLPYIDQNSAVLEKQFINDERIDMIFSEMGKKTGVFLEAEERKLNRSYIYLRLKSTITSNQYLQSLHNRWKSTPAMQVDARSVQPALSGLLGRQTAPLSLYISGPALSVLDSLSTIVRSRIQQRYPQAIYSTNYFERYPALVFSVDRIKLARYNLTPSDLTEFISATLKGHVATEYRDFDRKISIVLRGKENLRTHLDDLLEQKIAGYPLYSLITMEKKKDLSYIERKRQSRVFRLDMRADNLTQLASFVGQLTDELPLPHGYHFYRSGEWLESKQSLHRLFLAFALAILLVYLILAAQFESFLAPFIIMFTVPLAIIGIIPALFITGMSVNIMSVIGLVVIVGIVVNDGIIKIDFIRRAVKDGMPLEAALHRVGRLRLRPILMTTTTTVIGLLPLALGIGPGADLQQPMAIAIIGGESVATVLTLFVIPVLYKKLTVRNLKNND
ncbi:MAG: hypothetical protein GF313_03425 [Caldithrix sp.]|nr:hypothetical protein [Caldithrix sp.]